MLLDAPCLTREFVTIGLLEAEEVTEDEESLHCPGVRFLYVSRGLIVLSDCSMDRVDEGMGPALVCRLLNGEKRECGSIPLQTSALVVRIHIIGDGTIRTM